MYAEISNVLPKFRRTIWKTSVPQAEAAAGGYAAKWQPGLVHWFRATGRSSDVQHFGLSATFRGTRGLDCHKYRPNHNNGRFGLIPGYVYHRPGKYHAQRNG